jgi:CubicO group peptidase (beta-lactamase class C family)
MTDHDRYPLAIERIDEMLKKRHAEGLGPGLALAVTTRDELLARRTYGVANADSREPVTDDTIFQIGSISKHFTAVACMRLHEQGRLDLHAPLTDYLDWFEVQSRYETPITIHHLLTHTAGLVMMIDCFPSSWWQTWVLRNTQLSFEPGERFSYSNVGYNVLQCVIQTITGKRFDASLRELIFQPLAMADTYGEIRHSLHDRIAKGHKYTAHDDRPTARPVKQTVVNWYEMSAGCASVVTTATELSRFLRMLLRKGIADDRSQFLSKETFELMTTPHAVMEGFFDGTSQGYGVLIEQSEATEDRRRVIGGGENLGFEAAMYGDFEAGVGVVLFCNSFDVAWGETKWIMKALVAASRGEDLPELPELRSLWSRPLGEKSLEYVGTYASENRAFKIVESGGSLELTANGTSVPLEPLYGDHFIVPRPGFDHAMLSFGRDENENVVDAFQLGEWFRNESYDGPTSFATPASWDGIVGQYRSFGILVTNLRIFVRKGRLVCQSYSGFVDEELNDLGDGWFSTGDEASGERMTFDAFANGKALRCRASGGEYYRMELYEP